MNLDSRILTRGHSGIEAGAEISDSGAEISDSGSEIVPHQKGTSQRHVSATGYLYYEAVPPKALCARGIADDCVKNFTEQARATD